MENLKKAATSIKNWAPDDRPREKLLLKGAAALSDSELLAILINNGHKEKSAVDLAKMVLQLGNNNLTELGKLTPASLQKIKGIGKAKAVSIAAALELGRRRQASSALDKKIIQRSQDIAAYLHALLKDFNYEVFAVVFLNNANKVLHFEVLSSGGLTGTVADPRVILKKALEVNAVKIVLSHNHPSGSLRPSQADEMLTKKIKQAAASIDIEVVDHIIVSEGGYYSFADEGLM
jgi:DNA repair protein RadC